MAFSANDPKPGPGRPKGSVNQRTLILRDILDRHHVDPAEQMLACIAKVTNPRDRAELWAKLLPFYYPKLNALTVEMKSPEALVIDSMSIEDLKIKALEIIEGNNEADEIKPRNDPQAKEAKGEST